MIIGNKTITEAHSSVVIGNLYAKDNYFIPGQTCTDKYKTSGAGVIYIPKLGAKTVEPAFPGAHFVTNKTANSLISIALNNDYMLSEEINAVAEVETSWDIEKAELEDISKACRQSRNTSGLACLAHEGNAVTGTTELDKKNIKDILIKTQMHLSKSFVEPNVVLCSPDMYGLCVSAAGTEFIPIKNEEVSRTGQIGNWLGMQFINCPLMVNSAAKYNDYNGTAQTEDLTGIDFIMYNGDAFSVIDVLDEVRVMQDMDVRGKVVQVAITSGFRVTRPEMIAVYSTQVSSGG